MKLRTTGWAKPVENPEIQFKFHLYPHIIGFLLLLPAVYFFSCRGNIIIFLSIPLKTNKTYHSLLKLKGSLSLSLWFFFFLTSSYFQVLQIHLCLYLFMYLCMYKRGIFVIKKCSVVHWIIEQYMYRFDSLKLCFYVYLF